MTIAKFHCLENLRSVDNLIASRSPPGRLHPLHEINELVIKSIENIAQAAVIFYVLFITWDPLLPLWDPFWSHFCKLGTTFGGLWLQFVSKKRAEAPEVPPEAPK